MEGHHAVAHGVGADSRLATDEAQPGGHGVRWNRQQSRNRRGTARRWQQDVADSDEAQPGAATHAAQPEGMCRM